MGFISRSIEVNRGKGSSHSYSYWLNPGNGWSSAYPETTGYLLPTLLQASQVLNDHKFYEMAESCTKWLCDIQHEDGWYYSGTNPLNSPSVFNTAIVMQGLIHAHAQIDIPHLRETIERCAWWLLQVQDDDGRFTNHAYSSGYQPAYYTKVAWALLEAHDYLGDPALRTWALKLIETLKPDFAGDQIKNAGFHRGQPAFLHTIAYALRGAVECNRIINTQLIDATYLDRIVDIYTSGLKWPGRIVNSDEMDLSFRCLTGEAQMAILLLQNAYEHHRTLGRRTIEDLCTILPGGGQAKGGLAGSKPLWGPYMRFKYPNWASKFMADALMSEISISK